MVFLASTGSSKQRTGHNRLIFCARFPKASQMRNKFWNMRVKAIRFCLTSLRRYATTLALSIEMWSAVHVSKVQVTEWRNGIDAMTLAQNFGIGLDTDWRTLKATMQRGVRTVLSPTLSRRFRTNNRQLRYRRLPVDMFTNTMFSKVKSKRGNTCAQVFWTAEEWTRVYPMKKKSEAHEADSIVVTSTRRCTKRHGHGWF
jgi:hypothetical protein